MKNEKLLIVNVPPQDGEKPLPIPGTLEKKPPDENDALLPTDYTGSRNIDEIRGDLEKLIQDTFADGTLPQITGIEENGIFYYNTGQAPNVRYFRNTWRLVDGVVTVDWNQSVDPTSSPLMPPEQETIAGDGDSSGSSNQANEAPLLTPEQELLTREHKEDDGAFLTPEQRINIIEPKKDEEEK